MKENPITVARAKGYIPRPQGYHGINAAWMCYSCGAIRPTAVELMRRHGSCMYQHAIALVKDDSTEVYG